MFTKSIRWRLQLWQAFLLLLILSGFGVTAYQLHRNHRMRQVDEELERRIAALSGDTRGRPPFGPRPGRLGFEPNREPPPWPPGPDFHPESRPEFHPEPGMEPRSDRGPRGRLEEFLESREIRLSVRTLSLFDQTDTNDFYFAIWSRGGKPLKQSTNAPPNLALPTRLEADTRLHIQTDNTTRQAFQFTEIGECILAGRSIADDLQTIRRFAWLLVAAGGGVLALGLGGGWLLASRALRPVEEISAAASRISVGSLSERICVSETDSELGHLADVLNSTFARLEAAFAQQKQFTADASHELRTPIAVLISEAQTTLARERTAGEYREAIVACLDTAQQMRRITQSLLELARYDAGQETIKHDPFDLAAQTRACLELVLPLARDRGLQVHCDLPPTEVHGDADRLNQVITNLLANAIYYNKDEGEIRLATRMEKDTAILTVADTGQGISPEDLPHIFKRFYRADKCRTRSSGHTGLGLAICKAIVEAHGGRIEVSSQPGVGTQFNVILPK